MLCWVLAVVFEEFEVTPVVVGRARRFASEGGRRTQRGEQEWNALWL
jgi:hypothetical protein